MTKKDRRKIEMGDRVVEIGTNPELALTPAITAHFVQVSTIVTTMKEWGSGQASGTGRFRGGAQETRRLASEVRAAMRDIAEIAKVLTSAEAAGASELFRMPGTVSFQSLLAAARHFADDVEPLKAVFIAKALPATFVDDLEALITAFEAAITQKANGRTGQIGGTAGLDLAGRSLTAKVRELRAIMRVHLKSKPALLEAWKSAARVERNQPAPPAPVPPDSGTATPIPPSGS